MSPSFHIVLNTLPQAASYIAPKCNYVTLGVPLLPPADPHEAVCSMF